MVSKQHCHECGFLMMYEVQGDDVTYKCVNIHEPNSISEEELAAYKALGTNLDLLLEYLKRP